MRSSRKSFKKQLVYHLAGMSGPVFQKSCHYHIRAVSCFSDFPGLFPARLVHIRNICEMLYPFLPERMQNPVHNSRYEYKKQNYQDFPFSVHMGLVSLSGKGLKLHFHASPEICGNYNLHFYLAIPARPVFKGQLFNAIEFG